MGKHESREVRLLLAACPSLESRLDLEDGPYGIMGVTALMIRDRKLSEAEIDCVLEFFNQWAEDPGCDTELLGTGALEILNDDRATARLARAKLRGPALALVEQMRISWGQPDYSEE